MALSGTTNEQKIWHFLMDAIGNPYGVAGLMGNLYAESGLRANNLQNAYESKLGYTDDSYTTAVDNGSYGNFVRDSAGYGLAQWTYWSRKQALKDYADKAKKSIGDLEMQLGFLVMELTGYSTVLSTLTKAKSVREASDIVLLQFERPADQSESVQVKRASYGQEYYNKYAAVKPSEAPEVDLTPDIKQAILTKNPCYTAGRTITVKGLMLHSVGCPQPSASVFINNWNSASYDRACVHGFIDANTGAIYQTLPWNHRGWHGGGSSNNTHIGVEMCEPACIKYTSGSNFTCSDTATARAAVKRTYESAVKLFAYLCEKYGLNPLGDGVIVSHKEGCARGIASNHGDPEHLWNGLGMGYTMNGFRQAVKAAMNGTATVTPTKPETPAPVASGGYKVGDIVEFTGSTHYVSAGAASGSYCKAGKAKVTALSNGSKHPYHLIAEKDGSSTVYGWVDAKDIKGGSSAVPYMVRVDIDDLNIRKGPGTNYDKTGKYTGKGTFTIVQESSGAGSTKGWGKLKSGAGWISLDYCAKV